MKTKVFLETFKSKKRELKTLAQKVMLTRMVASNISDLFDKNKWEIDCFYGSPGIRIYPIEGIDIPVNEFDKLIGKLAKAFHNKPYMEVDPRIVNATFYLYPCNGLTSNGYGVSIEIVTKNTESCDFEEVEETITRKKLTGYCKALAEKQYQLS